MGYFVVSYDLHNERHYKPIWDLLGQMGATKLLESTWLVSSNESAAALSEKVKAKADSDDSVAVLELKPGSGWATNGAEPEAVTWLRQNITP